MLLEKFFSKIQTWSYHLYTKANHGSPFLSRSSPWSREFYQPFHNMTFAYISSVIFTLSTISSSWVKLNHLQFSKMPVLHFFSFSRVILSVLNAFPLLVCSTHKAFLERRQEMDGVFHSWKWECYCDQHCPGPSYPCSHGDLFQPFTWQLHFCSL